ncbi:hypothetical protein [Methanobrevibacter sp.]|uniref:hypothetical protein n=1 Tax=Methanobrevibacter sp. TaxID=66852 RepID=UPI003890D540
MIKKTSFLILIFSIVVLALSAVSAVESQNIENNTVAIGGVDFTIPDNFHENVTLRIENQTKNIGSVIYILDSRAYENEKNFMTIFVSNYNNLDGSKDIVNQIGGDTIQINSEKGFLHEGNQFYSFTFEKDGKIVALSSDNKDLFREFVI